MPLKNNLKTIRMRDYQMNVSEFSDFLGIKITTYSQWEKGVNAPSLEKAYEIAKKLNKEVTEIWELI